MAEELVTPETFEPNAFYERLLELRRTNPQAFESISPPSRLALARYGKLKREHEHEQALRRENDLPPAA